MADVSIKIEKKPSNAETYLGVEYIESTGNQYIQIDKDIDYNTTNLYVDYQYTNVTGSSDYFQGAVYCISDTIEYSDSLWATFSSSGYGLYAYSYNKKSNYDRLTPNASTNRCVLERNSNGLFFNNEQKNVNQNYIPEGNKTSNITLFALNYGDNEGIMMKSKMRIYAFKLGNEIEYKYNLVPCVRKSDNVAGMYDTINKKFYTNVGDGEFVVGNLNGETYFDNILTINKQSGLKSIESLSQSTGQLKDIFYGVTPNSGSIEILDRDGSIRKMIMSGELPNSNMGITLFTNRNQIQSHISTDSFYNDNTKVLSIEISNFANLLNNLTYIGYKYPNRSENIANILFDVLLNLCKVMYGEDYILTRESFMQMLSNKYSVDMTIYEYLESISIQYPIIESGRTYRDVIDSICLIAQIQMYFDDKNNITFVSARPLSFGSIKAIRIPKNCMMSQLDYDVILKNKYNNVELGKFNIEDFTKQNTNVFSVAFNPILTYDNYNTSEVVENSGGGTFTAFVRVESFYTEGEVNFDKKQSNNLVQILGVDEPQKVQNEEINEQKYSNNIYVSYFVESFYNDVDKSFYDEFKSFGNKPYDMSSLTTIRTESTGLLSKPHAQQSAVLQTAETSLPDNTYLTLEEHETYYTLKYKILTGKLESVLQSNIVDDYSRYVANIKKYTCNEVSISIDGVLRTISFSETYNKEYSNTQSLSVVLSSNKLIQTNEIVDNIKNNILLDYQNGISTATMSICCMDLYNGENNKILNWYNGEIVRVNDIVYFDNDTYSNGSQRYWIIRGRKFRYVGVPLIDLELQEVKFDN